MKYLARYYQSVVFCLLVVLSTATAQAEGYLVQNAMITRVTNIDQNNEDRFLVGLSGGTGLCANDVVVIGTANSPSQEAFKRAFTLAITAQTTGMTVDIYSYG